MRHDPYVALDVRWFTDVLKPVQLHNDVRTQDGKILLGNIGNRNVVLSPPHDGSWERFKEDGILEPELARELWPNGLSEHVLPMLDSMDLTFPFPGNDRGGLVVPLRLKEDRSEEVERVLQTFSQDHRAAMRVTWSFPLGIPPGAIERMLVRCCNLGEACKFWRFGVLVRGRLVQEGIDGTFALLVEYSCCHKELSMDLYGNTKSVGLWAALSFAISAVLRMTREFPGLEWKGSLACPEHSPQRKLVLSDAVSNPYYCPYSVVCVRTIE